MGFIWRGGMFKDSESLLDCIINCTINIKQDRTVHAE